MDFAKRELAKHGWREGMGLGRDETGILQALKPLLKFDKAGMGFDAAATFTNHWWENAFNAAADTITVNKYVDGSVTVEADNVFDIDNHIGTSKMRKHSIYDNFVMRATLTNKGAMAEELQDPEDVPKTVTVPVLTDEELFRACGGRTAHKGARHGLGLNGKLARIEEQERLLLNLAEKVPESVPLSRKNKSKKHKVSDDDGDQKLDSENNVTRSTDKITDFNTISEDINNENTNNVKKEKKRKKSKKDKHIVEEITLSYEQIETNLKLKDTGHKKPKVSVEVSENCNEISLNEEEIHRKKSKKTRREKSKSSKDTVEESIEEKKEEKKERREKKSKKSRDIEVEEVQIEKPRKKSKKSFDDRGEAGSPEESVSPVTTKKEKRKKRKRVADDIVDSTDCMADGTETTDSAIPSKKKKKSHKKKHHE